MILGLERGGKIISLLFKAYLARTIDNVWLEVILLDLYKDPSFFLQIVSNLSLYTDLEFCFISES